MTDPTQDPSKDDESSGELDWAAAMAEQAAGTNQSTQAEGLEQAADDWAAALAEQTAAESAQQPQTQPAQDTAASAPQGGASAAPAAGVFKPLVDTPSDSSSDIDMIMDIPVQ